MPTVTAVVPFLPRNRLLAALPADLLEALRPHLKPVQLTMREVVQEADQPIASVYFPDSGWFSMLVTMEDGDVIEVGQIGREGMLGLPVLMGTERDNLEAMVQGSGTAWRMDAREFRQQVEQAPDLRDLLMRFAMVHHAQVTRTAACNGRHRTEQRLARWLLMAHDRAETDTFPMTHDFIAMMLGVRRAGVSVAAGLLQEAGIIHYERGHMAVVDRPGLEKAACECYGIVRRVQDRLLCLPADPRSAPGTNIA